MKNDTLVNSIDNRLRQLSIKHCFYAYIQKTRSEETIGEKHHSKHQNN